MGTEEPETPEEIQDYQRDDAATEERSLVTGQTGAVGNSIDWSFCAEHKRTKHNEPITLGTGVKMDLWVCPDCDRETEENLKAFSDRIARGDFG